MDELGDVLWEFQDVLSSSKIDFGSCFLIPFKITAPGQRPRHLPSIRNQSYHR